MFDRGRLILFFNISICLITSSGVAAGHRRVPLAYPQFRVAIRPIDTVVKTFRFSFVTLPTSTLGVWGNRSKPFPRKRWMRSPTMYGRAIFGNYKTLWSEPHCYLLDPRCVCHWLTFLMTQASARLAGTTRWNKPGDSRLCERSAKAIGLSEAHMERHLD